MFDFNFKELHKVYHFLIYPFEKMTFTSCIFLIVAIAHQRWVVISSPIRHKQVTSSKESRRKRALFYILPSIGCAVMFNIPKFLSYQYNKVTQKHEQTDLRQNYHFVILYENLFCNAMNAFVPITLLIFFNWNVYNHIKTQKNEMAKTIAEIKRAHPSFKLQKEIRVETRDIHPDSTLGRQHTKRRKIEDRNRNHTIILFTSILVFIICHSFNCLKEFYDDFCEPFPIKVMQILSRLLLILHSSSYPFIYIWKNAEFRLQLKKLYRDIIVCECKQGSFSRTNADSEKSTSISSANRPGNHVISD